MRRLRTHGLRAWGLGWWGRWKGCAFCVAAMIAFEEREIGRRLLTRGEAPQFFRGVQAKALPVVFTEVSQPRH
jgi:hypothetical protein